MRVWLAKAALVCLLLSCCGARCLAVAPRVIQFGPAGETSLECAFSDGSVYSKDKGLGWDQDLTRQTRDRGDGCTGIALLSTGISKATFTIDLPDGSYVFNVTAYDTQYSGWLAVQEDGQFIAEPLRQTTGKSVTLAVPITSRDGKASITFIGGRDGIGNSLLSSIIISSDPTKYAAARAAVDAYRKRIADAQAERTAKRARQRAAYRPIALVDRHQPRQTIDLSGKWLFAPNTEISKMDPASPNDTDSAWHVMNVPDFWKPIEWWIYMEGAGTSHNFLRDEIDRCAELTFDYKTTDSGFYRQWISIPESMKGRRIVLRFDAVASVAKVYWNGAQVGSHIGVFGPFECEVTPHVRFGQNNLLTVFVSSGRTDPKLVQGSSEVAVTVNITAEMLNSLAHGWYKPGMAGIWQPVSLIVTGHSRIADVFFKPSLDRARIQTEINSTDSSPLTVRHSIVDATSNRTLYSDPKGVRVVKGKATLDVGKLRPKLWSPEHPNLYVLKTKLISRGTVVDEVTTTVGFKTFEARGNRLYLNGKPYFLRGADMPPHGLRPNDKALADKFMKMMHDGNTMATRFHVGPPSKIWLDAADKYGVGASVGENWPWILMGSNPIPDKWLVGQWQKEFLEVVHANRNHPSMFMWTISNESYFEGDSDAARRLEKYRIFSDLINAVRRQDPGTPIVFHSGHVRTAAQEPMLKANNLDDGDIDDEHAYFGWYDRSPFHVDVAKDTETRGTGKRPLISQEASTGYPDNDTGHPVETYIRNHVVPQAWVGDHALYSARPDMFLDTHGQITKEYAEKIRRDRTMLSGWMLFANCCWFRDVYSADTIAPYPVYWGVRKAYQPVLVSLDSPNRHFRAGEVFASDVVVVNDDPDRPKLTGLTLVWRVRTLSNNQTSGRVSFPDCAYDGKCRKNVEFQIPTELPVDRSTATLQLELRSGDDVISTNDYPLIVATEDFYRICKGKTVVVLDTDGKTADYLETLGLTCIRQTSADWKNWKDEWYAAVIGPGVDLSALGSASAFADFIRGGGRALIIGARNNSALAAVPYVPPTEIKIVNTSGDFADILAPELLSGLDPMDMHWWNAEPGGLVRVCEFGYQWPGEGIIRLARHIQPHGYIRQAGQLQGYISCPAFEDTYGAGKVIVSSFLLADDPLARRFTANLIARLRE